MSVHGQQLAALAEYASESITVGSKSFAGASRLFDRELRASSQMLYAWCRYCDDVIDGQESGFQTESQPETEVGERLRHLRELTQAAIDGHADTPAFAALSYVLHRHDIPARFPMELLDGFEMDVLEHQFSTIDDTIEYSYYVAGVVGIMMAMIMGVRDDGTLDRACERRACRWTGRSPYGFRDNYFVAHLNGKPDRATCSLRSRFSSETLRRTPLLDIIENCRGDVQC